jgi:hypothetical protein
MSAPRRLATIAASSETVVGITTIHTSSAITQGSGMTAATYTRGRTSNCHDPAITGTFFYSQRR